MKPGELSAYTFEQLQQKRLQKERKIYYSLHKPDLTGPHPTHRASHSLKMGFEGRHRTMENFSGTGARAFNWTAIGLAVLQSVCALALVLGSVGALIGFSLITALSGLLQVAVVLHTDWIRLPMIGIALAGALLNLWVLSRLRRLRANPASAWRRNGADPVQLRQEKIQLAVALATIALVLLEVGLHLHNHGHI
jgi:hypothetical protein